MAKKRQQPRRRRGEVKSNRPVKINPKALMLVIISLLLLSLMINPSSG